MLRKTNLGLPLDEMIIVPLRMKQSNFKVREIHQRIFTANSEPKTVFWIPQINTSVRDQPGGGQNVLGTRINESLKWSARISASKLGAHNRPKNWSQTWCVYLEGISPRKSRNCHA